MQELLVRDCEDADLPAIQSIYAWHVQHGTGTFELEAPDLGEMQRRRGQVLANGMPWLVAQQAGRVVGYAYANWFRPRPAYRFCLEDSIYVAQAARGQGVGGRLLAELLVQAEARGARQMLAVIGDAANTASIAVHARHGFEPTGVLKSAGWKHGAWRDVVLMQRALGEGDRQAPEDKE